MFLWTFFQKLKKDNLKLPENYTVGEEYFKDPNEVLVSILVAFSCSSLFKSTNLEIDGVNVSLRSEGAYILLEFRRKISERLFKNLRRGIGTQWLVGYVSPYIDHLNQEIYNQRYSVDGLLLQPHSVLSIDNILVKDVNSRKKAIVRFPRVIRIENVIKPLNIPNMEYMGHIYIRDLVDAINSFLYSNFDDCVRRLITSIETSFDYYEFDKIKDSQTRSFFKGTLDANCSAVCSVTGKSVAKEIWELYKVRNRIVHEGHRIKPEGKKVCDKGIHYVLDYFKNLKPAPDLHDFAMEIEGNWIMYKEYVDQSLTLDKLKEIDSTAMKSGNMV